MPHAKTKYILKPGQKVILESPGGGGLYPPQQREAEMVREDVKNGFVSLAQAREVYRVVINPETHEVDWPETEKFRSDPCPPVGGEG